MVQTPTRGKNILDLFFTTNETLVNRVHTMPPLSSEADHDSIFLNISTKPRLNRHKGRKLLLYNKANWLKFKEELQQFYDSIPQDISVQELWDSFESFMHRLINLYIPDKIVRPNSSPPWLSKNIISMCKQKEKAYIKWKRSGSLEDELDFQDIKAKTQREIRTSHSEYLSNIFCNSDVNDDYGHSHNTQPGKRFWSYIKQKRQDSQGVAPLYKDGIRALDAKTKSNILNDRYCSVFTKDESSTIPDKGPSPHPDLEEVEVSTSGIRKLLEELNPTKASGPDQIPARILKECAVQIAPILQKIFVKTLQNGEVPNQWREANVTPIFKKGDRHNPANYRPVSLTSIICKLQEHIIAKSIMKHLEHNDILVESQHGFRAKRSCEAQLLSFIHDVSSNLSEGFQTDIAVMDFSKAFDKVSHMKLLYKLEWYGIRGNTLKWISSFLSGRSQRVILDGEFSNVAPVISGVPQGSVLGPILFLLFINDLPDNLRSQVRLFADDTIAYRMVACNKDCEALQADLDSLSIWEKQWGMEFNVDKCEILRITSSKKPIEHEYSLKGKPLKTTNSAKYLGVEIDSGLNWHKHINNITSKANRTLGFLRRNLKCAPSQTKELAYKSLVRPLLSYSSTVWDPFMERQKRQLEMVQRRAARFVCNRYHNTSSVTQMLDHLHWETLEERRTKSRLVMMYKITHQLVAVPMTCLVPALQITRGNHGFKYRQIWARRQCFQYSFFPRTIVTWNALPITVVQQGNLQGFTQALAGTPLPSRTN